MGAGRAGGGRRRGLKALVRLPADVDESGVVTGLEERGVAVMALSSFCSSPHTVTGGPAIVVNHSRPFGHGYRGAVDRLADGLAVVLPAASH